METETAIETVGHASSESPLDRPAKAELLAPAGDFESLRAAVANGADAVYFGLTRFNARHRAKNFTADELPEVMRFLHDRNVRGYVTLNTLIFSDELPDALAVVNTCVSAGVDAVIVQDLGLARLIHDFAPALPIHGSTQMTLTEHRAIDFVRRLGVGRVILARELSVTDIGRIVSETPVPVEVFVHGALCVAYSGQCLTSESIGGRSANRGQCAQACRLPYDLIVDGSHRPLGDKAYLLSPQDLAAHDLIEPLLSAGVCSLKIEGRLKSAQYVAAATQTYRNAIDAAQRHQRFVLQPEQRQNLAQSFSRGFTHGFLDGPNHQTLVHARFPKSRGLRVGRVEGIGRDGVLLHLDRPGSLKPGDGVVFDEGHPDQDEQGGRIDRLKAAGRFVEVSFYANAVNAAALSRGAIVWKTDDPAVRRRLEQSYSRDLITHRLKLSAAVQAIIGRPLQVELSDESGHQVVVATDMPLSRAEKFPLSEDSFREQFSRLGQTPFELATVRLFGATADAPPEPVMAPKSVLNELRRHAVQCLLDLRARSSAPSVVDPRALDRLRSEITVEANDPLATASLSVLVRSQEQLRAAVAWRGDDDERPHVVYCDYEDVRQYKEAIAIARDAGVMLAPATIRIVKPTEEGLLRQILDLAPDGVLVRNLAALSFFSEQSPQLPLFGDYCLNAANELTAELLVSAGLRTLVPSYDLNWHQLIAMAARFPASKFEAVVHQHMPMFHMEHCVFAHTLSNGKDYRDCGRPCETHRVDLRDRVGQSHPLIPDVGCRNTVYNASAQSAAEFVPRMLEMGIRRFRVELLRQNGPETTALLSRYARVLSGKEDGKSACRQLRVLNQLGVTRGTLDFE